MRLEVHVEAPVLFFTFFSLYLAIFSTASQIISRAAFFSPSNPAVGHTYLYLASFSHINLYFLKSIQPVYADRFAGTYIHICITTLPCSSPLPHLWSASTNFSVLIDTAAREEIYSCLSIKQWTERLGWAVTITIVVSPLKHSEISVVGIFLWC